MQLHKPEQQKIDSIIILYSNGQFNDAIKDVEYLINDYPKESKLFNINGNCYSAIGNLEFAIDNYKKAILLNPDYAEAHYNLGRAYQAMNQFNDSILSYRKAIASKPNYPEAYNNLGGTFQNLYQLDDAVESYKKALKLKPDYAEVHFSLGLTLHELGKFRDAVEHFEKTIDLKPNFADAHNNLGKTLYSLGEHNSAISHFDHTIILKPNFFEAYNNLGAVLQDLGQLDDAVNSYEKAISLKEDYYEAHYNLGTSYQALGNIDSSIKSYEKSLSIKPGDAETYHNLSYLKKYSNNDPQISKMHSLLLNNSLDDSERMFINFALARVYESLGNKNEFFKFLNEGNRLCKSELNYSIDQSSQEISAIKKLYIPTTEALELPSYDSSIKRPIFILGMPRSGTSLVEQIISNHHKVYGGGELNTLTNLVGPIVNNYIAGDIKQLDQKAISFIRQEYQNMLIGLNSPKNIITDKLPLNFKYIGFILSAFPEAKIVHLKRDAIATCWSNYRCNFTSEANGYSYNFDDLAQFYNLYEELMEFWHELYPYKIYDISYEDLTTNQEEETRKLLEYCELEWDENCLNFHTNKRAVYTASSLQVREKMYQGSSEIWKQYWARIQPLVDGLKFYKKDNKTS